MHGRLKIRTTEEQQLLRHKEQQKKLTAYRMGMKQILSTRNQDHYDPSSLNLSANLLVINPDIYTLWNFRKEAILIEVKSYENGITTEVAGDDESEEKLVKFLEDELRLTEQCLVANPKSYGSWHHRYWILDHHPKPDWNKEFNLCSRYFTKDDRNFHCWDYRRLIVNKIGLTLTEEIKFSTERINCNFSNYSSWHYRSTLLPLNQETLKGELTLVENAIFTDPVDSSAWFYLRWILSNPQVTKDNRHELLEALEQLQELEPDCKWIFLAKCWLAGNSKILDRVHSDDRASYCKELIKLDSLRRGYYEDLSNKTY